MNGIEPLSADALPAVNRDMVEATRALGGLTRQLVDTTRIGTELGALLDAGVTLRAARVETPATDPLTPDALAVVLTDALMVSSGDAVVVEVDGALASLLTSRVLDKPAAPRSARGASDSDALSGVVAAVVAALLRRVGRRTLMIERAASAHAVLEGLTITGRPRARLRLTLDARGSTFTAGVSSARDRREVVATPPFTPSDVRTQHALAVALRVVATTLSLSRDDLDTLSPGDALVPSAPWLEGDAKVHGPVTLIGAQSTRGVRATLRDDGSLVLGDEAAVLPADTMTSPDQNRLSDALSDALAEAPVVVRVEVGGVELSLAEWSTLGPGDVVTLDRRAGDPVSLRVGGSEVARGELVRVDDELAVRILSLSP